MHILYYINIKYDVFIDFICNFYIKFKNFGIGFRIRNPEN